MPIGRGNEPAAIRMLQTTVRRIDLLVRCRVIRAASDARGVS
jgi:hypothetical protein